MDDAAPVLNAIGVTVGLGALAFVGIAGAVLLARVARPTVERLAAVDLRAVSSAFGDALTQISDSQTRRTVTPQSN